MLVVNWTITQNDNNERYARPTGTGPLPVRFVYICLWYFESIGKSTNSDISQYPGLESSYCKFFNQHPLWESNRSEARCTNPSDKTTSASITLSLFFLSQFGLCEHVYCLIMQTRFKTGIAEFHCNTHSILQISIQSIPSLLIADYWLGTVLSCYFQIKI